MSVRLQPEKLNQWEIYKKIYYKELVYMIWGAGYACLKSIGQVVRKSRV